jgi:hypothetical protein
MAKIFPQSLSIDRFILLLNESTSLSIYSRVGFPSQAMNAPAPLLDAAAAAAAAGNPGGGAAGGPAVGGGGAVVTMTWENLSSAANLLPHEVGFTLSTSLANVSMQEALSPFVAAAGQPDNADLTTLMRSYADSLTPMYFLVVVSGKVEVLYGLRPCHAVAGNGARYLALMGERTMVAGMTAHPKLHSLRGQLNGQSQAIGREEVAAPTMENIEGAFNANAGLALVDALQADANGVPPAQLAAWKMLPIHPKFASLFFKGMTVRKAFALVRNIEAAIPQEHLGDLEVLQNFIRGAVTSDGGANPESALTTGWSRVDHSATPVLESWYYALVGHAAPTAANPPPGLPPLPPPAPANSDGIAAALRELVRERESPAGKAYYRHELEKLFPVVGAEPPYGPLTEASLPQFWRDFKRCRKGSALARGFLESHRNQYYPTSRSKYAFLFSPQLIKDLQNLDFTGGDELITFDNRHKGLSIFSLAPLEEYGDEGNLRDQMLHYEESASQHGPLDRAAFASLSSVVVASPTNRDRLLRWVDHCDIQITILLGLSCPLLAPLGELSRLLLDPSNLTGFNKTDVLTLLWMLHKAIRRFFLQNNTLAIERVVADLAAGVRYAHENLPIQMRAAPLVSDGSSVGTGSVRSALTNPSYGYSEGETKRQKFGGVQGAMFSIKFRDDINRAQVAAKPERFLASKLCRGADQMKDLLGQDFLSLVPPGQQPCLKFFIFGNCRNEPCHLAHALTRDPSKQIVDGIAARIKTRINAFVANPKA